MPNLRSLLWFFYKPLLVWNLAFNITGLFLLYKLGPAATPLILIWKLLGYASGTFLRSDQSKNVYMYYRNAGYSVTRMYAYVYCIDISLFISLLVLFYAIILR